MYWVVSSAGDNSYNGEYTVAGVHQSVSYYTYESGSGTRYLYWEPRVPVEDSIWVLSDSLGESSETAAYRGYWGSDLPANPWAVKTGTSPAPTLGYVAGIQIPPGPVGDIITIKNESSIATNIWVQDIYNDTGVSADLMLVVYTASAPHTLITSYTETVENIYGEGQSIVYEIALNTEEVLVVIWADTTSGLRADLDQAGYEITDWSATWDTPQETVSITDSSQVPVISAGGFATLDYTLSTSASYTVEGLGAYILETASSYGVGAKYTLEENASYGVIVDAYILSTSASYGVGTKYTLTTDASYTVGKLIWTKKCSYSVDGVYKLVRRGSYTVIAPYSLSTDASYGVGVKYTLSEIKSYAVGTKYSILTDASYSVVFDANKDVFFTILNMRSNYR